MNTKTIIIKLTLKLMLWIFCVATTCEFSGASQGVLEHSNRFYGMPANYKPSKLSREVELRPNSTEMFDAIERDDIQTVHEISKIDSSVLSEINEKGNTPLHEAVLKNNCLSVLFVLQAGADLNALNYNKERPIDLVTESTLGGIAYALHEAMDK